MHYLSCNGLHLCISTCIGTINPEQLIPAWILNIISCRVLNTDDFVLANNVWTYLRSLFFVAFMQTLCSVCRVVVASWATNIILEGLNDLMLLQLYLILNFCLFVSSLYRSSHTVPRDASSSVPHNIFALPSCFIVALFLHPYLLYAVMIVCSHILILLWRFCLCYGLLLKLTLLPVQVAADNLSA
jgi:hypothetical protein